MNREFSSFLNMSRWIAAFFVVISHVRHIILVDFGDVIHKGILFKAFYALTSLGHESVVVFFVLSGYLVGALTYEKWKDKGPHLGDYASARVSRIYTVLVPALLAGMALDLLGIQFFNSSVLYSNSEQYHISSLTNGIGAALDVQTFLGNLFMMQGILTTYLGSNGPLWSLSYEWWYYCLFALVGAALTEATRKKAWYVIAAVIMAVLLPFKILLWGAIWALGILAQRWISSRFWRPHPIVGIGLFLLSVVIASASHGTENAASQELLLTEFIRDLVLGIMFTVALVSYSRVKDQVPLPKLHAWLANFSYSTYLIHFPMMLFMVAVGYQEFGLDFRVQPTVYGLMYFFALTLALYAYCVAFWFVVERHTHFVRIKLDACMQRGRGGDFFKLSRRDLDVSEERPRD
jgi:peptidoglycan/LPS O-acetylase OafA/YrhL